MKMHIFKLQKNYYEFDLFVMKKVSIVRRQRKPMDTMHFITNNRFFASSKNMLTSLDKNHDFFREMTLPSAKRKLYLIHEIF